MITVKIVANCFNEYVVPSAASWLSSCISLKPRLHEDSDPDPNPDWLRLYGGKLDSNPDSDHLSHVDCDPGSNPDSGPGARVNTA